MPALSERQHLDKVLTSWPATHPNQAATRLIEAGGGKRWQDQAGYFDLREGRKTSNLEVGSPRESIHTAHESGLLEALEQSYSIAESTELMPFEAFPLTLADSCIQAGGQCSADSD
jgi:hypothetical protein